MVQQWNTRLETIRAPISSCGQEQAAKGNCLFHCLTGSTQLPHREDPIFFSQINEHSAHLWVLGDIDVCLCLEHMSLPGHVKVISHRGGGLTLASCFLGPLSTWLLLNTVTGSFLQSLKRRNTLTLQLSVCLCPPSDHVFFFFHDLEDACLAMYIQTSL